MRSSVLNLLLFLVEKMVSLHSIAILSCYVCLQIINLMQKVKSCIILFYLT
uniref:Uncharacterized protein n=1 Tax=Rhizophora mucronata TaxID=61149 RepID=A0A2P2PS82_RHIMU